VAPAADPVDAVFESKSVALLIGDLDFRLGALDLPAVAASAGLAEIACMTPVRTTGPFASQASLRRSRRQGRNSRPQHAYMASRDWLWIALLAVTVAASAGVFALVGADALWLAALGRTVAHLRTIPTGVPFAAEPTGHWPNAIVLAELIFHALVAGLGFRGLMLAQVAAVALAAVVLAHDARAGGTTPQATTAALLLAVLGVLPDLSVIRVQLFSIALFPVVAALLRSEARNPSRRIWLVVPLLALWSNVHGAALIGLAMTILYLSCTRLRHDPWTAIAVAVAAVLSVLVTPAGIHTLAYYHGVLTNRAAQQGEGMWTPLSPGDPLDFAMIAVTIALAARLPRIKLNLWELIMLAALAALTIKASRSGVWLLLFLVPLAARTFTPRTVWDRLLPPLGTVALVVLVLVGIRGPSSLGASPELVSRAITQSNGRPIVAEDVFAEQVAAAGGKILVGNPIDAFSRHEQDLYLDWTAGKHAGLLAIAPSVSVALTSRNSAAERLMRRDPAFRIAAEDGRALLFTRVRAREKAPRHR
jgi:hypothetical protein